MADKRGSSSKATEKQQLDKSPETSTNNPIPLGIQEPPPAQNQGGSSQGPLGGAEGTSPVNMEAILISGSTTDAVGGGLNMGTRRKRGRKADKAVAIGERAEGQFQCTVCGRGFPENSSLFGHALRLHRGRGWKKSSSPPLLSREESAHMGLERPGEQEDENAAQEARHVVAGEATAETQEAVDPSALQPVAVDRVQYCVPDLNSSPPPNWNGNDGNGSDEH